MSELTVSLRTVTGHLRSLYRKCRATGERSSSVASPEAETGVVGASFGGLESWMVAMMCSSRWI